MRQHATSSSAKTTKAGVAARLLLTAVLALSSLFMAAPVWASEIEEQVAEGNEVFASEASSVSDLPITESDQQAQEPLEGAFVPLASYTIDVSAGIADGPGYTWDVTTKVITFTTAANENTYTLIQSGAQNVLGLVVADGVDTTVILKDINLATILPCIEIEGVAKLMLTLEGKSILNSNGGAGIEVAENASLTIQGSGELNVTGDSDGAGIGGGNGKSGGNITINGGIVTATGDGGAGIGGGAGGTGGTITINGGTVEAIASGPWGGAGIGGGYSGNGGIIIIADGIITATGSGTGAGIGGGYSGAGGTITINGGIISAAGGGAGIGSGVYGSGGIITINNGTITANGGGYSAGIGGGRVAYGYTGSGGIITINNGTITANGGAAGIGGGASGSGGIITINGGAIVAAGGGSGGGGGGAGIGGGGGGFGGTIVIAGGSISATGGRTGGGGGSGIGGGGGNAGGSITIEDGIVIAVGNDYGAGIGGGREGVGGTITISGGAILATGGTNGGAGIGGGAGKVGDPSTSVSIAPEAEIRAFAKNTDTPAIDAYYGNAGTGHYIIGYLDAASYARTLSFYADGATVRTGEFPLPADYASFAYTTGTDTERRDRIFAYRVSDRAYLGRAERVYDSSPDIASTKNAAPVALRLNSNSALVPPDYDPIAPALSAASVTRTSRSSATINFSSNEAGSYYYAIVSSGASAPTINTTGQGIPLTTGAQSVVLSNLGATAKDIYLVAKDAAGNVSPALKLTVAAYIPPITQHEGATRHDTAARASQKAYPDPALVDTVVLAYAGDFPDALAASYLAGALDAPILLNDTTSLDPATAAELNRLAPSTIYIVGGEGAIAKSIEDNLNALSYTVSVIRLGGAGRTETAYKIATETKNKTGVPTSAFVVDAANFPDALSAGSLAAGQKVPILLTDKGNLDGWTRQFLTENNIRDIIIVGGTGSVSAQVETQLKQLSYSPSVSRWSGTDRFATAKAVFDRAIPKWGLRPTVIGLASGWNFPDALVGGAAMGNRGGFLIITEPDSVSEAARVIITNYRESYTDIEIFGGTGTIRVADKVRVLLA